MCIRDSDVTRQCVAIMCADNGVVEEGVASAPQSVTCLLYTSFWYIPLPLCFVVLYLILCIGGLSRQDGKKSFYIVNMQFVYFASINLIILGTMALANRCV